MSALRKRIELLTLASKGINPTETEYNSDINELLSSIKKEGLIHFKPENNVNAGMQIELTDAGHKRLDEMKRSRFLIG